MGREMLCGALLGCASLALRLLLRERRLIR
jgi:uncharacterized OsmC-like protein